MIELAPPPPNLNNDNDNDNDIDNDNHGNDDESLPSTQNFLNVLAFITNSTLVYLVCTTGFMGATTIADQSAKYPSLVTPASWTYFIWGLIYFSQGTFVVLQLVGGKRFQRHKLVQEGVKYNYIWVCFFQIVWAFCFGLDQIELAAVFTFWILFFLVNIVVEQAQIKTTKTTISPNMMMDRTVTSATSSTFIFPYFPSSTSFRDYWLFKFPFSLHCGWIVANCVGNTNTVLVKYGLATQGQFYGALLSFILVLVAAGLSLSLNAQQPDFAIATGLAWFMAGIFWELLDPPESIQKMFDFQDILRVRNTAGIASVFILISVLLRAMIAVYHHYYYHCDDHTYNWDDEHHQCYCNSGGVDGRNVWDNYENGMLFGGTGSMLPSKKMRSTSTMMKIKKQQIQKKKQMGSTYDEGEDEELDDVNIEDDEEMRRMKTNLEMGYIQQED